MPEIPEANGEVQTIELVNEPALKRVPELTGSPVVTSTAP